MFNPSGLHQAEHLQNERVLNGKYKKKIFCHMRGSSTRQRYYFCVPHTHYTRDSPVQSTRTRGVCSGITGITLKTRALQEPWIVGVAFPCALCTNMFATHTEPETSAARTFSQHCVSHQSLVPNLRKCLLCEMRHVTSCRIVSQARSVVTRDIPSRPVPFPVIVI